MKRSLILIGFLLSSLGAQAGENGLRYVYQPVVNFQETKDGRAGFSIEKIPAVLGYGGAPCNVIGAISQNNPMLQYTPEPIKDGNWLSIYGIKITCPDEVQFGPNWITTIDASEMKPTDDGPETGELIKAAAECIVRTMEDWEPGMVKINVVAGVAAEDTTWKEFEREVAIGRKGKSGGRR